MRKTTFRLLVTISVIISFSHLQAGDILLEARGAYYYPTDHRFRDIYSDAGLYSVESSVKIDSDYWGKIYPWASLGFLYTSGSSIKKGDSTELYSIPLGIGIKYFFDFDRLQPYLGIGVVFAYTHIHNDSPYVRRNQSDWGAGVIGKSGFLAYVTESVFFDFFLDYTYLKKSFDKPRKRVTTRKADLSGVSVGGGIGYRF